MESAPLFPLPKLLSRAEAAADIRARPPSFYERRFALRNLVHTTLPHRLLDLDTWRREAGRFALELSPAARDGETAARSCRVDIPSGVPYGPKARLLLLYACTWALQTKNPRLPLGSSLTEFLQLVGLNPATGGGRRGDAALMKEQLYRFWCTSVAFVERGRGGVHALRVPLSNEMSCWWENGRAWEDSYMRLSDEFMAHVATPGVCVPLDLRAVFALSKSSLALDLYALLANRSFVAEARGARLFLSWQQLAEQLGQGYGKLGDFRRSALRLLPQIAELYPALDCKVQRGGRKRPSGLVILEGSRPAVPAAAAD